MSGLTPHYTEMGHSSSSFWGTASPGRGFHSVYNNTRPDNMISINNTSYLYEAEGSFNFSTGHQPAHSWVQKCWLWFVLHQKDVHGGGVTTDFFALIINFSRAHIIHIALKHSYHHVWRNWIQPIFDFLYKRTMLFKILNHTWSRYDVTTSCSLHGW